MTLEEEWGRIIKFNDKYFPGWREDDLRLLTNALAGEVGEACNSAKHMYGGGTNTVDTAAKELPSECVDVFIYLILIIEWLGGNAVMLADLVDQKMQLNKERMDNRERAKGMA